jgi:hypothetical protein
MQARKSRIKTPGRLTAATSSLIRSTSPAAGGGFYFVPCSSSAEEGLLVVTQHTTASCSMQVVVITPMKYCSNNITSIRVVQQKYMRVQRMSIELHTDSLQKISTAFTMR